MTRWVAAAVAALALLVSGCSADEYVAPPSTVGSNEAADPTTAAATLTTLQEAIRSGDAEAAAELGSGDGTDLLAALADNARALRLAGVSLRYVTETGRTSGSDGWDGLVAVTWQLRGYDEAAARTEVPFSFADGGQKVTGIGAADARLPLWLSGPLEVRRSERALVLSAGSRAAASAHAKRARIAVTEARKVLGGRGRLVVEVPADEDGLDRALDVDDGSYAAIAAITAPVDGSRADGSPVHVFVNPAVYDDLDPVAAQVVMTHEAVHALTDAARARRAPLWLVEGFADYVALRDVDLPLSRTAGQVLKQVRRNGAPKELPGDADFDPSATHLGTVYESSWQVAVTLAEQGGEAALVELYRAVLGGTPLTQALRAGFGWSVADLTGAWQARLESLAGM